MPSPYEAPGLWRTVVIGEATLPPAGVAGNVALNCKPKVKDDKKSPSGKNGGRNTTQGLDLAEGDIEVTWADAPGFHDRIQAEVAKFWPPTGAKSVTHGATDFNMITDIEIRSMDGPTYDDGKGKLKITWRQWVPDKKSAGSGSATKTSTTADPTKQWMSKYGPSTILHWNGKNFEPTVPLGEIQP